MMVRYFSDTAIGGKLYPDELSESSSRTAEALVYYPEDVARMMVSPYPQDALVTIADDPRRIVQVPRYQRPRSGFTRIWNARLLGNWGMER